MITAEVTMLCPLRYAAPDTKAEIAISLKMIMMYLLFSDLIIAEHLSKVKLYICNHTNFIALQYATPNFNLSN